MRNCHRCGVPRILTSEHRWNPAGTISLTRDETHRMVFVDNDGLDNVYASIAERIGLPVDNIIVEAKRKSARHFMNAVLSGVKGVFARNLASAKVYQYLGNQLSMLGLGHAEVISYKRRSHLEGIVSDCYSPPALTGDICGSFESVEKRNAVADYSTTDEGPLRVVIEAAGDNQGTFGERFSYEPPPLVPGRNIIELCPVCRTPLGIGRQYSFDMERGVIHENKTVHRVVLIGVMTLNNLFGELEEELGEEIPNMIMNIERERVRDLILAKKKELDTDEKGYMRYMETLRLKGMGNGSAVEISGGKVKARVDNPYYEPLIAGFLAGFFEATTRAGCSVGWTPAESVGYTEVTLESV